MKILNDFALFQSLLERKYKFSTDSYFSLNLKRMMLPDSIFTLEFKKTIKLKNLYSKIIDSISISSFSKHLIESIDSSDNFNFSRHLDYLLMEFLLKEVLELNFSKEIYSAIEKASDNDHLESRKKIMFLSALPIPTKIKLLFTKKKKLLRELTDSITEDIYQLNIDKAEHIKIKYGLSEKEIKTFISTITANSRTLSSSISVLLKLLVDNSEHQHRFVEDDKFAIKCYMESLRLYPVISFLFIKSKCPFSMTRYFMLNLFKANRNNIEEPHKFIPERKSHQNLAFGIGERKCIAKKFSIYLAIDVLQSLFSNYEVSFEKNVAVGHIGALVTFKNPLLLNLKEK